MTLDIIDICCVVVYVESEILNLDLLDFSKMLVMVERGIFQVECNPLYRRKEIIKGIGYSFRNNLCHLQK